MIKYYFKIWCTEKELWSKGGSHTDKHPWHWSKTGKVWNSVGALKNHLNQFKEIPSTWKVVKFKLEILESENCQMPASDFKNNSKEFVV